MFPSLSTPKLQIFSYQINFPLQKDMLLWNQHVGGTNVIKTYIIYLGMQERPASHMECSGQVGPCGYHHLTV